MTAWNPVSFDKKFSDWNAPLGSDAVSISRQNASSAIWFGRVSAARNRGWDNQETATSADAATNQPARSARRDGSAGTHGHGHLPGRGHLTSESRFVFIAEDAE